MNAALFFFAIAGAEGGLDARVSVDFRSTPFIECLRELKRKAGIAYAVDGRELDASVLKRPVTLKLENVHAREVLDMLVELVGAGYVLEGLVALVTSPEAAWSRRVVLEVYDVRDIVCTDVDFPAPDLSPGRPSQTPNMAIVVVVENDDEPMTIGSVAEMIQSRIAPDSWAMALGTSIWGDQGMLLVRQTPKVHEDIRALLARLRSIARRFVEVEVAVIALDPPLEPLPPLLSDEEAAELVAKGEEVFHSRTMCLSRRKHHVFAGNKVRYVAHIEAGEKGHKTRARELLDGFCADVMPVVAEGGAAVVLDLKLYWGELVEMKEKRVGRLWLRERKGFLNVQAPVLREKSIKTSVRVPRGSWAVMEPPGEGGAVVLVRAALLEGR